MPSGMDAALGNEDVREREAQGEPVGRVFFLLICGLAIGRMSLEEAEAAMDRAVHRVIR